MSDIGPSWSSCYYKPSSISLLPKHIFVTFLPSREKQIVAFWYLLEMLINSVAKRTLDVYYFQKAFSKALEIKRSHRDSGQVDGLKLPPFQMPNKTQQPHNYERRHCHVKGGLLTILCLVVSYCKTLSLSSVQNSCRIGQWLYDQMDKALERLAHLN